MPGVDVVAWQGGTGADGRHNSVCNLVTLSCCLPEMSSPNEGGLPAPHQLLDAELQLVLVADLLTFVALVTELLLLVVLLLGFGATCLWSWGLGQSLCLQSLVTLFGG